MNQDGTIRGWWWRFTKYSAYEVSIPRGISQKMRDHFRYIVPVPEASLQTYEPAIGVRDTPSDGGQTVVIDLQALQDLKLADESAILEWCQQYGLLGILPETASLIELAPRYGAWTGEKDPPVLFPTQRQYFRTNVGWSGIVRVDLKSDESMHVILDDVDTYEKWNDRLVDPNETRFSPGAAVITRLFSSQYERKDLAAAVGRYFPRAHSSELNTAKYPLPLSDDFWHGYAESIADFRTAVLGLRSILSRLSETGPIEHLPEEALRTLADARAELHSLLSVSPGLGLEIDGTFTPKWAFSSLLSMFALTIWEELVSGRSIRSCKRARCQKPFFVRRRNQSYCSSRCRQAEEKARQRRSS